MRFLLWWLHCWVALLAHHWWFGIGRRNLLLTVADIAVLAAWLGFLYFGWYWFVYQHKEESR